jgi:hypothetical protein
MLKLSASEGLRFQGVEAFGEAGRSGKRNVEIPFCKKRK